MGAKRTRTKRQKILDRQLMIDLLLLQTLYSYNVNKTKQNGGQDESKIN